MARRYYVGITLEPETFQRLHALKRTAPLSMSALVRHAVNVLLEDPAGHPVPLVPVEPKSNHVTFKEVGDA